MEEKMIVGPNKGVFFGATALMCAASLYGAKSSSATDPMTRIFVGEPHQLTVPPGFQEALAALAPRDDCAPRVDEAGVPAGQSLAEPLSEAPPCVPLAAETADPVGLTPPISAPSAKARVIAQPASAASTVERP
jgi:hypothetical protein